MDIELLKVGCLIMIIGMGFVYFFIFIMICFMEVTSKLVKFFGKYFPEEAEEDKTLPKKRNVTNSDAEIALAIACAAIQKRKI